MTIPILLVALWAATSLYAFLRITHPVRIAQQRARERLKAKIGSDRVIYTTPTWNRSTK